MVWFASIQRAYCKKVFYDQSEVSIFSDCHLILGRGFVVESRQNLRPWNSTGPRRLVLESHKNQAISKQASLFPDFYGGKNLALYVSFIQILEHIEGDRYISGGRSFSIRLNLHMA